MKYREIQREKVVQFRDQLFGDPGDGIYKGIEREFVLSNPYLNLWNGIREDALQYFRDNNISWWDSGSTPSGHLLSSQIACINHLFFIREHLDLATSVLKGVNPKINRALKVDTGFVEFEKVGENRLGKEEHLTRGANCTSIDAMMLAEQNVGKRILVLIEWKYTEYYSSESKLKGDPGTKRMNAYQDLLNNPECPIEVDEYKSMFYEPFYQLMRQTLLAWEMTNRGEYGAEDWIHVHVIPAENTHLRETITSPDLHGDSIADAWRGCLKHPDKFISLDPKELLKPIFDNPDEKSLMTYLNARY